MAHHLTRRGTLAALTAALTGLGRAAQAATDVIDLQWGDLIPNADEDFKRDMTTMGIVQHGTLASGFFQPQASGVTTEFDGKTVRIPGFIVPVEYGAEGVTAFILVPYVGACIHVPPPPPNQLVYVTSETPYPARGLFEPVWVVGSFGTAGTSTELANIGYAMDADRIDPYQM